MTKARLVQTLEGHLDRGTACGCLSLPPSSLSLTLLSLSLAAAWHLAWNPASPILASCSTDKCIRLYSYAPTPSPSDDSTAKPYRFSLQSTIPNCHPRTVRSLEFSPTGATLATASFDATVGIWCQVSEAGVDDGAAAGGGGAGEWEPVDPLEGHESECKSVAWSADGRLLASCSRDKSVWVWEGTPTSPSPPTT